MPYPSHLSYSAFPYLHLVRTDAKGVHSNGSVVPVSMISPPIVAGGPVLSPVSKKSTNNPEVGPSIGLSRLPLNSPSSSSSALVSHL